MWGTNLYAPPITSDLWAAIRDRCRVTAVEAALGTPIGGSRVYIEGDQPAEAEGLVTETWGRVVIVPADPLVDPRWDPGTPVHLSFLVRAEVNAAARANYSHSFHLQRILREVYRVLQHWGGPITSNEVMIAGAVAADSTWRALPLDDSITTGTVLLSQRYSVDVCEAITAA